MEYLDYFDPENNNKLGVEERATVHNSGFWHREVSVWVVNEDNEVLLQKRSPLKKISPNKWSACAGHIVTGESIELAAVRELFEEVGLKAEIKELIPIGVFRSESSSNNHYKYVFLVKTDKKITEYVLQEEEVSEVKYVTIEKLEKILTNKDENVTFARSDYAKVVINKLKEICEVDNNGTK